MSVYLKWILSYSFLYAVLINSCYVTWSTLLVTILKRYNCIYTRHEGIQGSGRTAPHIRNVDTVRRYLANFTHWSLFLPEEGTPNTHWVGDLVGPRTGPDIFEKSKSLLTAGIRTRVSSAVTIATILSGLVSQCYEVCHNSALFLCVDSKWSSKRVNCFKLTNKCTWVRKCNFISQ